jgi:hypothetical protein
MMGDGIIFNATVGGSPITSAGTLVPALLTQSANRVLASPTSGSPGTPTFRALVAGDLPAGAGTVSSVALTLSVPASFLSQSVTGSPITTSGTLAGSISLLNQAANLFFAGPTSGGAAVPNFRAVIIPDLPFSGTANSTTFARGDGTWAVPSGSSLNFMNGVVPAGSYPGTVFTAPHTPNGLFTLLTKNGLALQQGVDYTISTATITYVATVGTTDKILIWATY